MSYCFNPSCQEPQNADSAQTCQFCGSLLQLQGRYHAIRLLGQGGFGRTFLAVDTGSEEREVRSEEREGGDKGYRGSALCLPITRENKGQEQLCVVKQLFPQPGAMAEPEQAIALFRQEAARLGELGQHPQIPTLLDFFSATLDPTQNPDAPHSSFPVLGRHKALPLQSSSLSVPGSLYLIQEFIEGTHLEQRLAEQGVFSEAAIWQVLEQLLPVLKFIHDRQVIHRDIKPANIICQSLSPEMLPPEQERIGRLVLVDFGAAKLVKPSDRLQTGTSIGSAEYVAPEQARGKAVFASDLYSLGVSCIHLLTNLSPFDLFDSLNDGWVWRQSLAEPVSDRLAHILDRLIQPALGKRFQSVNAVLQAMGVEQVQAPLAPIIATPPAWKCLHTLTGHTGSVNGVAISPLGQMLASGSEDKTIRLWDLATGEAIAVLTGHTKPVNAVAWSPNGSLLASASQDETVALWDGASQTVIQSLTGHTQAVKAIAFSPNGKILASASWDKTIRLWNLTTQECVTLTGHRLQVTALAFSPDGHFLASASTDRTARIWKILPTNPGFAVDLHHSLAAHVGAVFAVVFSPDGAMLATGGDDRTLKLWDTATGQLLRTLPGHSWAVSTLAFSPDGKTLVSGSLDTLLKLWQIEPIDAVGTSELRGHTDSVHAVTISADGQTIASGSRDQTIRIWQKSVDHSIA